MFSHNKLVAEMSRSRFSLNVSGTKVQTQTSQELYIITGIQLFGAELERSEAVHFQPERQRFDLQLPNIDKITFLQYKMSLVYFWFDLSLYNNAFKYAIKC